MTTPTTYILTVTCPAATGIVAAITGFLAAQQCYITEMAQYDDEMTQKFFCRIMFRPANTTSDAIDNIRQQFAAVAQQFTLSWLITNAARPTRVMLMVSKADHCLVDLLYRKHKGDLNMQVVCVVSNHTELRSVVEREGIRFICLPVDKTNKADQEARMLEIVAEMQAELVVLARYMQILSNDTCRKLEGMCINIHHSFLPSFKGAKPYHQAFDKGVKLIGATAHFVTADLDEGPIIEQDIARVDHAMNADEMTAMGRDVECITLARAVKWHGEHRVLLNGKKTVVFK